MINASGTYDAIAARKVFGDELLADFPFSAFVSKTITPEPRAGNEPRRIWETPAGMINSIGLPNKGLEGFLAEDLPQLAELPVPLIVSVMATNHEEFAPLVGGVAAREEVAAIELNVCCPNVHSGLIVGEQPAETEALMEALRPLTEKPLIVKLTPNVAAPAAVAVAAEEGGADAVSLINTLKASAIDPASGARPSRRAMAASPARRCGRSRCSSCGRSAAVTEIPAIGMGGISSGADAANSSPPGRPWWRSGPRVSATRARARGLQMSWKPRCISRSVALDTRPRLEVQTNFGAIRPSRLARPEAAAILAAHMSASPVKSSLAAPERSLDQRMEALRRANDIRTARAKLKKDLKASRASIQTILLDPPEYVLTAKVFDMLLAVPKYGRVKTNRILNQCRISPSKTIGGLSERQRAELVSPAAPLVSRPPRAVMIPARMAKVFVITGPSGSARER